MSNSKILIAITGSIAGYKVCEVISQLKKAGHQVQVVATTAALKFVGEATLEGLSGRPVQKQVFASAAMMQHIDLGRWADLLLVAPATANSINSAAAGLGNDLLGNLLLAWEPQKPLVMAPAMNVKMWQHPSVSSSIDKLESWGVKIIPPDVGNLACGEVGEGRLADPQVIYDFLLRLLKSKTGPRVLITAGGTREPIDSVRCIANNSTGKTGVVLATELWRQGFDVTLLKATGVTSDTLPVETKTFTSFNDLKSRIKETLSEKSFDYVVHAAAVSDYTVAKPLSGKISSGEKLTFDLIPTEKLIEQLKSFSKNPEMKIIGFKLTSGASIEDIKSKVGRLMSNPAVDWVFHNDIEFINSEQHRFTLFDKNGEHITGKTKQDMAAMLASIMRKEGAEL